MFRGHRKPNTSSVWDRIGPCVGAVGLLVLFLGTVLAGLTVVWHVHFVTPPAPGALQQAGASARYVDPALCAQCHPKVWETYRRTGMARSFYRPTAETTVGNDRKTITSNHKASESYFTMLERDGHLYQRRYQIGFDGKETNRIEKEIDYIVGSTAITCGPTYTAQAATHSWNFPWPGTRKRGARGR